MTRACARGVLGLLCLVSTGVARPKRPPAAARGVVEDGYDTSGLGDPYANRSEPMLDAMTREFARAPGGGFSRAYPPPAVPVTCEVDLDAEDAGYLMPREGAQACGLPLGRPYLLSKYGLALVPDRVTTAGVALDALGADAPHALVVRGCRPTALPARAWADGWSVGAQALGWCDPEALDVWARLVGPSIVRADVVASRAECSWELRFRVAEPGGYALEVLSIWQRGGVDPHTPHYERTRSKRMEAWTGTLIPWSTMARGAMNRGSPYMLCGDRCSLFERCAAWTQFPPGKPPACYLFAAVNGTRPMRTKDIGERGHRKEEEQAHHLGAIVKGGNGQWPQHLRTNACRRQAHALRSPLAVKVVGASPPPAAAAALPPCADGASDGRWVRAACPPSKDDAAVASASECRERKRLEGASVAGGWEPDYVWRPWACREAHYELDDISQCVARRGIASIFLSGDSVMQACSKAFHGVLFGAPGRKPTERNAKSPNWEIKHPDGVGVTAVRGLGGMKLEKNGKSLDHVLDAASATPDGKIAVVLCNFGIQHAEWGKSVADVREALTPFADGRVARWHCKNPRKRVQQIMFGGVAVHGFREPYVTYARARNYTDLIYEHLRPLGWELLDTWYPTAARPEGAEDGMHYHEPVCTALIQSFLNVMCGERASYRSGDSGAGAPQC